MTKKRQLPGAPDSSPSVEPSTMFRGFVVSEGWTREPLTVLQDERFAEGIPQREPLIPGSLQLLIWKKKRLARQFHEGPGALLPTYDQQLVLDWIRLALLQGAQLTPQLVLADAIKYYSKTKMVDGKVDINLSGDL